MLKQKYVFWSTLVGVIFLTIVLRLYHITYPVADWHSWRQVDTAAVARNFIRFGVDPLRPRYDDLSNIQSGKDNPQGYRMVEFPIYQLVSVYVWKLLPFVSIEIVLRLVMIASAVGSAVVLVFLVRETVDDLTGIIAGILFAVLPYSVYYTRAILPDGFMLFWALLSVYAISRAMRKSPGDMRLVFWGSIAGGIALLVKPVAVFLLFPVGYFFLSRFSLSKKWFASVVLYVLISIYPLWSWRQWILQFPEGIPVFTWLFNEGNIRFKGAWFYWLFAERISRLILGYWGLIPLGIGMMVSVKKRANGMLYAFGLGAVLYMIIIARGNVQHDYYQILLLPTICIFTAKGIRFMLSSFHLNDHDSQVVSPIMAKGLAVVSLIFTLAFSWYTIRTYYWINRQDIVDAGKAADQLLPKDAKVIASYNGDTTFLYQINRQGWPLGFDIDQKIAMGATHYVTVSPTDNDWETKTLAEKYTVLVRNDRFAIIDLTKLKK